MPVGPAGKLVPDVVVMRFVVVGQTKQVQCIVGDLSLNVGIIDAIHDDLTGYPFILIPVGSIGQMQWKPDLQEVRFGVIPLIDLL